MRTFLAEKILSKKFLACIFLLVFLVSCIWFTGNNTYGYYFKKDNEEAKVVYMVEIEGEISKTTVSYIQRALHYAKIDRADYFLLDLNGYSGYDNDIKRISEMLTKTNVHTLCYVDNEVLDGATLLALSCNTLAMSPSAVMGTDYTAIKQIANDEDKLSDWQEVLQNVLYYGGHNIDEIKDSFNINSFDELLTAVASADYSGSNFTISANDAYVTGLVDFEATSMEEIFTKYHLTEGVIIEVEKNAYESFVDILATPFLSTLMLSLGLGILLVELFATRISFNSIVGIICMMLYFLGGYYSGSAGGYVVFLLLGSLVLLLFELFVSPGSGICGIIGACGFFSSIMMMAPSIKVAGIQIVIVLIIAMVIIMSNEKSRNILKKLVLRDRTTTEEGYLSQPINIRDYMDAEGVALTALRPAGAVKIGSERVDVVTEGDFIAPGDKVKVIKVDGSSVIVRKL